MKNSDLTTGLVYDPTAKDWKMDGTPIEIVLENPSKPATEKPELPGYEELKGLMTGATIESAVASSPFASKKATAGSKVQLSSLARMENLLSGQLKSSSQITLVIIQRIMLSRISLF